MEPLSRRRCSCCLSRSQEIILDIIALLDGSNFSIQRIQDTLSAYKGPTSAVLQFDNYVVAWVDHIRSWPIFYSKASTDIYLTDDICALNHDFSTNVINTDALVEFCTSGYVSGSSTILNNFYCFEPGDLFIYDKKDNKISFCKHFEFDPKNQNDNCQFDFDKKCAEFEEILNEIFDEIISRAEKENARIWVPLMQD